MGLRRELRHHAEVGNVPNTAQAIAVAYLCRQGPAMTADDAVRVAAVLRDYGLDERAQAPEDSRAAHGG